MLINLKVKTLDAQTHEFSIDNEITVREFKDEIAKKTSIAADQQRIIYCGRVLVDEKQLKNYDVDGKVVHVAERPPPSQRGPSTSSSTNNDTPRDRSQTRGMRASPLFRALDGLVVGTMAIPVNPGTGTVRVNPFTASSSFCMNRITVARHMLECANNIAAYLEEPQRGLNNTPLDILTRGRWTMESTVVEVGIAATDMPPAPAQNIMDMVQGAVTAAIQRHERSLSDGDSTDNITAGALPTRVVIEGGLSDDEGSDHAEINITTTVSTPTAVSTPTLSTPSAESTPDAESIPDLATTSGGANTPDEPNTPVSANTTAAENTTPAAATTTATTTTPGAEGAESTEGAENTNTTASNNATQENSRRTGTQILAEVVDQMRQVQNRLNPFIELFHTFLQEDPQFPPENTEGPREAQRLYDRVSEALHYMSHAQHAISDLMLDVSQPAPRYLTCRPILVEQSGYVSSNNYITAAAAAAAAATAARQHNTTRSNRPVRQVGTSTARPVRNSAPITAESNAIITQDFGPSSARTSPPSLIPLRTSAGGGGGVDDPIDDPIIVALPTFAPGAENVQQNGQAQAQMARFIQAYVNSNPPIDAELHVQISAPNILAIAPAQIEQHLQQRQQRLLQQQQQQMQQAETPATTTAAAAAAETAPVTEQATATSTPEQTNNAADTEQNDNSSPTTTNETSPATATTGDQARVTTATLPTTSTQTRSTSRPQLQIGNLPGGRIMPYNMISSFDRFLPCNSHHIRENMENGISNNSRSRALAAAVASRRQRPTPNIATTTNNTSVRNLRTQLLSFINENVFAGEPINTDTIPNAVNRTVNWFLESLTYLPQYEKPEYDSRDSLSNIVRRTMPLVFDLMTDNQDNLVQFEQRLKRICEEFRKRLYSVLIVCIGQANADVFWGNLMRFLLTPLRSRFRDEALQFLCVYINPDIPSSTDVADAEQFLVIRNTPLTTTTETTTDTFVSPPCDFDLQPMDADVEMVEVEVSSTGADLPNTDEIVLNETAAEPLPNVVVGSEPWHSSFPNDWLPVITRDVQTQAESDTRQPPFSDAYISGMSSKRRKLIQGAKATYEPNALLAGNVRKAITTVGVTTSTAANQSQTMDEITNAIANDAAVHASYVEAVRTNVRDRLKKEPDYKAEKYPQTTKFINK